MEKALVLYLIHVAVFLYIFKRIIHISVYRREKIFFLFLYLVLLFMVYFDRPELLKRRIKWTLLNLSEESWVIYILKIYRFSFLFILWQSGHFIKGTWNKSRFSLYCLLCWLRGYNGYRCDAYGMDSIGFSIRLFFYWEWLWKFTLLNVKSYILVLKSLNTLDILQLS